ncbi:ABC transporter related [Staphylothermus marinus F1]|uniref:ABC transporter related n=1 Tax=Staphylothermus marinus (strain ATCC 43588 / DSM 3639 / JCM 9404 / F1) TaxID=399550 RepID=A3DPD4_STAMF|nr:ABC transporter ATP-binding protein [Staphylothermus marinus]ABN70494.1 ABC transporter related [Staphylothermus marinus F1]
MAEDIVIKVVDLHKYYILKGETVKALQGINLEIYRGEYVSILGPSGSGKTTLFNMIGGLDKPTSGKVYVDGVDIYSLPKKKLAYFRNKKLGYVFQTYNLIPYLTALDNVALPMVFAGVPRRKRVEKARKLLEAVGLGERLYHRPFELSGGQQQRVAIARALANDPSIILADEPTANLDLVTGKQVINLLKDISLTRNVTVVTNTHDLKMIDVSDRIVYIRDGKIERIEERQTAEIRDIIIDIG